MPDDVTARVCFLEKTATRHEERIKELDHEMTEMKVVASVVSQVQKTQDEIKDEIKEISVNIAEMCKVDAIHNTKWIIVGVGVSLFVGASLTALFMRVIG